MRSKIFQFFSFLCAVFLLIKVTTQESSGDVIHIMLGGIVVAISILWIPALMFVTFIVVRWIVREITDSHPKTKQEVSDITNFVKKRASSISLSESLNYWDVYVVNSSEEERRNLLPFDVKATSVSDPEMLRELKMTELELKPCEMGIFQDGVFLLSNTGHGWIQRDVPFGNVDSVDKTETANEWAIEFECSGDIDKTWSKARNVRWTLCIFTSDMQVSEELFRSYKKFKVKNTI